MPQRFQDFPPETVLWGGTGQAKVLAPIIEQGGSRIVAVFNDFPDAVTPLPGVPLFHGPEGFRKWIAGRDPSRIGFAIAIGNPNGRVRVKLHDLLKGAGLRPLTVVHPFSWVAPNAVLGEGCQVMAGAVVQAEARLGRQCIVNTKASVDHEDVLGDGVEISPGATLCGSVTVGDGGWICAGATVRPFITIGADAIVGAGAVVVKDVPAGQMVMGVPAKAVNRRVEARR